MPNIGISQLWRTLRQLQRLIAYGISFSNKGALENGQRCHGLIVQDETMLIEPCEHASNLSAQKTQGDTQHEIAYA
ncbi:hypothetical protein UB23_20535 [Pseudomonas sp. ES3-33]|nr:hypothetical protein UB23_20535 [Pseudomonas sp. ES3-33]